MPHGSPGSAPPRRQGGPHLDRITDTLAKTVRYAQHRFVPDGSTGGWRQFLNEDGAPSITGTACVITSLVRVGISPVDPQVRAGTELIRGSARADGGWSKPELDDHASLTLVSCLALNALQALGYGTPDPATAAGLIWLVEAQNTDGGWGGIRQDGVSNVTATAYALRALAGQQRAFPRAAAATERGVSWLLRQRQGLGGWGQRSGQPPTLPHTSHAVEGLIAAGHGRHDLAGTYAWMCDELERASNHPWVEHYNFPGDAARSLPPQLRSSRLSWTHLPTERTLIALLRLGADPTADSLSAMVGRILDRHTDDGYWQVPTVPGTAPAWAVLEAVEALVLYLGRVENAQEALELRTATEVLERRIVVLEQRETTLTDELTTITDRLDQLAAAQARYLARPYVRFTAAIGRLFASKAARSVLVTALTAVVTMSYLLWWSDDETAGTKAIGVATLVAAGAAILALDTFRRSP